MVDLTRSSHGRALLVDEGEEGVGGRVPRDAQLLRVDHLVRVDDLADELLDLLVVHLPDLVEPDLVALLEPLELLLKLLELPRELLVPLR